MLLCPMTAMVCLMSECEEGTFDTVRFAQYIVIL